MAVKHSIIFLAFSFWAMASKAQWYNPEKVSRKAQAVYNGAVEALQDGNMVAGKTLLRNALSLDRRFVDAWLSMAGACGQLKQYDSAVLAYGTAFELDSVYAQEMLLPYSINLAALGRFEAAQSTAERLLSKPNLHPRTVEAAKFRLKTYQFAVDFAAKYGSFSFNPTNLGDSINSAQSEYYPSFTINDSLFVFTRRGKGIREDFIKSQKTPTGNYALAKAVGGKLNEEPRKGGSSMSPDGDWLFYAAELSRAGYGNFDIYLSYATPDGWSAPFNLGGNINTEFWESSPSISPDKQTLYFSSSRPGGFGGKDLYTSQRLPNGQWTPAQNMGPNFNTTADELAPFIHTDNQTLYFTSGGHPGYGGSDVYLCRKGPAGHWSVPQNLGYPINTIEDEGSLIVTANGKSAYYASNRADSRGGLDLYTFEMPLHARPKRTLWVQGTVADAASGKGLPSTIQLKDIATGQVLEQVQTDETGRYLVTLPVGRPYTFTVNRKGYLYYSDAFEIAEQARDTAFVKNITLQAIALNQITQLKNIFFESNTFALNPASFVELDKLVQLLAENASLKVEISGHTDNVGKSADNLLLSSRRAKAVVAYLTSKGIGAARLTSKGFGSTKPIADNKTEAGRASNRRTEMKVVGL
ncbi:MAG: flagellar motor protein MotB [Bacteroidetes bacterium]|nr:MAG: flagellar motor protein MotB [Bacteroidota bacterium]